VGCDRFLNCDKNEIYFVLLLSHKNVLHVLTLCHILYVVKIAMSLNVCINPFSLKLNGQDTQKKKREFKWLPLLCMLLAMTGANFGCLKRILHVEYSRFSKQELNTGVVISP